MSKPNKILKNEYWFQPVMIQSPQPVNNAHDYIRQNWLQVIWRHGRHSQINRSALLHWSCRRWIKWTNSTIPNMHQLWDGATWVPATLHWWTWSSANWNHMTRSHNLYSLNIHSFWVFNGCPQRHFTTQTFYAHFVSLIWVTQIYMHEICGTWWILHNKDWLWHYYQAHTK